ncbi:LAME_0A06216g1_1 [Lachancea meyersii CBS 8951]|uniref:Nucleotide exchange factor SIL1 n=1 Tax=Lachancea meyersii CBS 8951 TaxID=1266667 RepID=A0A1G4IQ87_9SACH|nr:LAME_0A06216g1_1 [Lachancea meyersii CBS 8951]
MRWITFCIAGALANELITLSPTTELTNSVETSSGEPKDQLYIGDDIICNQDECYPKIFEAQEYWQEIRPEQQITAGLDVRMNLETGLREAKLSSKPARENQPKEPAKKVPDENEPSSYEFSQDFAKIRELLAVQDYTAIDTLLDDLLEFSHDFKHGYKILTHEFGLLKSLIMAESSPMSTKLLTSAMFTACLRNNPPSVSYVQAVDPAFTQEIFTEITGLITGPPKGQRVVLVKRYLSIVQAMANEPSDLDESILLRLCHWGDAQIKRRALETAALLFHSNNAQSLQKMSQSAHEIQKWVDEFSLGLQDEDVDELHIRNFFNSLHRIKEDYTKDVKLDSTFLNWLGKEATHRQQRLKNGLQERDLEQDEFDQKLIDSRHLVFGNPMAHRIKRFDDEL